MLPNFPSVISLVAFSPDGQQIITAGSRWDQTVKKTVFAAWLWDLATGTRLQSFNLGDKTGISLAAFSDDGRQVMLAIGGELSLWDPATGEKIRDLHRLKSGVFSRTTLTPDGRQLLWQHGMTAKLLNVESGTTVFAVRPPPTRSTSLAGLVLAPDGKTAVLAVILRKNSKFDSQPPALLQPQGWFGMFTRSLNDELASQAKLTQSDGAYVLYVQADSPADKAGLKQDDVILKINNQDIANATQCRSVGTDLEVGAKVVLDVIRQGEPLKLEVVLGVIPSDEEAFVANRKGAELGNARAQSALANQYRYGQGLEKDLAGALKWFQKSAEQGDSYAETSLASMYSSGEGVSKDENEALKWRRRAAEQGDEDAMCSLAEAYKSGTGGISKDSSEAIKWFRRAAQKGSPGAQFSLGQIYRQGEGVPVDTDEALKWYRMGAEQGNYASQNILKSQFHQNLPTAVAFYTVDTSTGKTIHAVTTPFSSIKGVFISPNGRHIVALQDDEATVLDIESGKLIGKCQFRGQTGTIPCVAATSRGLHALLTGKNQATLWDLAENRALMNFDGFRYAGSEYALNESNASADSSPAKEGRPLIDIRNCLIRSADNRVAVLDVATAQMISLHPDIVAATQFKKDLYFLSPDNRRLLTMDPAFGRPGGFKNATQATVWDPATGQKLHAFSSPTAILAAAFSPDGQRLLTCPWSEKDNAVLLWDLATGKQLHSFEKNFNQVGFTSDGRYVLAGAVHYYFWDATKFDLARAFREEPVPTSFTNVANRRSFAFSPDGLLLATIISSMRNFRIVDQISVWNAQAGTKLRSWETNANEILFSSSGTQLLLQTGAGWKLWDVTTGDELAQIVCLGNGYDWLIATPEGLFDGTEGARYKACYRIGGGLSVVPADRFFQDFYRPGLLAQLLRGERPMPDVHLGKSLPPLVRILSPEPGVIESQQVTVEAEATDEGGGVANLAIFQNGARVLAPGETRRDGKTIFRTFQLPLVEGDNNLRVTAATDDGTWEAEPAEIMLRYEKSLAKSRLYVVAVGINKYADANLNLRYAAKDAQEIAALFQRRGKGLYAQVDVTSLLDQDATKTAIKTTLKQVAGRTQPQDTLMLFLAGHGTVIGQRYYFVPYELHKEAENLEEDISKQGLPADELSDCLASAKALKRILIVDTCASGGALGSIVKTRSGFDMRAAIDRLSRTRGIFTIAAASAVEQAQESKELGHGVLSYALLAGLKDVDAGPLAGKYAQPNGPEGVIDVMEWFNFAVGQVPRLTEKLYGAAQEVQTSTQGSSFPVLPLEE